MQLLKHAETHVCFLVLKKSFGTSDAKVMKVFTKIMRRKLERETLEKRNIFFHQESSGPAAVDEKKPYLHVMTTNLKKKGRI